MTKLERAEQIKSVIKECNNYHQLCKAIGIKADGGSYLYVQGIIKEYNIDISHFHTKKNAFGSTRKSLPLETILVKGSYFTSSSKLKNKLIDAGLLEEKCYNCLRTQYDIQGKLVKMPLQLHHIDGDHCNNELSNLILLCPICHSLTSNHRGKNKKKFDDYIYCKDCGKKLRHNKFGYCKDCYVKHLQESSKTIQKNNKKYYVTGQCKVCGKDLYSKNKTQLCSECYKKSIQNVNKPSKEVLAQEVKQYSFLSLGRKYNVSDNTIRNWCVTYGIDYKQYGKIRIESLIGLQKGNQKKHQEAVQRKKGMNICPKCGGLKHISSKLCRICYLKSRLVEQ